MLDLPCGSLACAEDKTGNLNGRACEQCVSIFLESVEDQPMSLLTVVRLGGELLAGDELTRHVDGGLWLVILEDERKYEIVCRILEIQM